MKKLNTKSFIKKVEEKFPNRFTFKKTNYINQREPVTITCKEHGDITKKAQAFLRIGTQGCPECKKSFGYSAMRFTQTEVIAQFKEIHGDKYDYSKMKYINNTTKVEIICREHGSFFQIPKDHKRGVGCDVCGGTKKLTHKDFLTDANLIHNEKYIYPSLYVSHESKIKIGCKTHGIFTQTPHAHLSGQGCPMCSEFGFNENKPAILYYLKVNDGVAYKIGITNNDVTKRFSKKELLSINILKVWYFDVGIDAYKKEQEILKEFNYAKYSGEPLLKNGNTELFDRDVLLLD
jgi:hypothetical protein